MKKNKSKSIREELSNYCVGIGKDPLLVQGAGGNISWKDGNILWVKASGTFLSDAMEKDIFVPVNLEHLKSAIHVNNFGIKPTLLSNTKLRPSIETFLHAIMPHTIVLHLHPVNILSYLVREDGLEQIKNKICNNFTAIYLKYYKPGEELASAMYDAVNENNIDIIFLQNHGIVIGGDTISKISDTLQKLIDLLVCPQVSLYKINTLDVLSIYEYGYVNIKDEVIQQLALNLHVYSQLSKSWALYPDHVVFLGKEATCFTNTEDFISAISTKKEDQPRVVFIKRLGVYALSNFSKIEHIQLRCYADIMIRQNAKFKLASLSEEDIFELLNWEAEKYRKKISK